MKRRIEAPNFLWWFLIIVGLIVAAALLSHAQTISNVRVVNVTSNSADLAWATDIAADSAVLLGWNGGPRWVTSSSTLTTQHTVHLSGLQPGYTYAPFVLRSKSATGTGFYDSNLPTSQIQSFTTLAAPVAGTLDMNLRVIGPANVIQGYSAMFGIERGQLSGPNITTNSVLSFSGLPPSVTIAWPDCQWNDHSCIATTATTMTQYGVSSREQFMLRTSATTPPGTYTITLTNTVAASNFAKSAPFTVTVRGPPQISWTPPSSLPPIPQLALWESQMVQYGQRWCGTATDYDQTVGYYDGEWVYRQIQAYDQAHHLTGKPEQWTNCINQAHQVYSQRIQAQLVPGYWVFPNGLYAGGDYADLHLLAGTKAVNHGMSANRDYAYDIGLMREMGYQCGAFRLDQKAGNADWHNQIEQCVDYALGYIDKVVNSTDDAKVFENFMGGICMGRMLVDYFEDGHRDDARIRPAMQALWDWMFLHAWSNAEPGAFVMQMGQYQFGLVQALASPYNLELRGLNLLIAPMGGWLCKMGAGQTYCDQADTVFVAGVTAPLGDTIGWSGKNFSQNYIWSFFYVDSRTIASPQILVGPATVPSGIAGKFYSVQFSATGGSGKYVWTTR